MQALCVLCRRLDELNRDFNLLWDWLVAEDYDPEQCLEEARSERGRRRTR